MIVLSHRGPFRFQRDPDGRFRTSRGAGGVVSALLPLLIDRADITWVAAAMSDDDREAARRDIPVEGQVRLQLLQIDPEAHRLAQDVVANGVLWFLHHGLFDLTYAPTFDRAFRDAWEGYVTMNRAFADAACAHARPRETVLVQDYQLGLVPAMMRSARPDLHVAHFTHTPFCGPNSIGVLPEYVARALCASLAGGAAGFHTARWARAYAASARHVLGDGAAIHPPFHASFAPDVDTLVQESRSARVDDALRQLDEVVGDRQVIVRADRLELSKNIVRGFVAYDLLLEHHPELRERVVFVALLNPSRESVPAYAAYRAEVETAAARVTDRWGTAGWDPIVLDTRDDFARTLAGFRRADAVLVNPVKDGLNLVAKEAPLVNERDAPLCLSRETGAFEELADACITVQPFDVVQTAGALHEALTLPAEERRARAKRLRERAVEPSPQSWLERQMEEAISR